MMKIRKIMAVCMTAVMLTAVSACGSQDPAADSSEQVTDTDEKETTTTEAEEKDGQGQDLNTESEKQESSADEQESGPTTIKVFRSNDDATQLVEESVEIEALTPENVLKALVENEILPENVGIISLEESEQEGGKALDVNFTRELGDYIRSMGSTGEYMVMGGLCNTFLDAYGCDMIQIKVEGEALTTGHKEYTGYQKSYQ